MTAASIKRYVKWENYTEQDNARDVSGVGQEKAGLSQLSQKTHTLFID